MAANEHEPNAGSSLEIVAYRLHDSPPPLVCAQRTRAWMDSSDQRFAYRCLPLLIANQAGWFVLNESPFEATWDGSRSPSGVHIRYLSDRPQRNVSSHFGEGVITWHLSYLFRTPPDFNLLVRGPSNWPKDGVQALEGIVETDWTFATFTMNWKLTRPDHTVRFDTGEPFCMLVPQRRGELEAFTPKMRDLSSNPELQAGHKAWADSRGRFLSAQRRNEAGDGQSNWQKHYFQGRSPHGESGQDHQTVLSLGSFTSAVPPSDREEAGRPTSEETGTRPAQQPEYRLEEKLEGETLLYHPSKTTVLYLNPTASLIWELCDGRRTTADIVELLQGAFPEATGSISDDVESILRKFIEHEAIRFV